MPTDGPGGTITKLEVQKNDDSRVSVYLDGEFAFGIHQDLILHHGLHTGMQLSAEKHQAIEQDEARVQARQRALQYLAHKPRTEKEVREKLESEEVPQILIEDVVDRLHELSYLDDEDYAHNYARNRFANKGYGPRRIRRELVDRGIDRPLADRAVDQLFTEEDPMAAAMTHAEKYWPRVADEDDPRRRKQKLHGYLTRRGFTQDTVYDVIDAVEDRHQVP